MQANSGFEPQPPLFSPAHVIVCARGTATIACTIATVLLLGVITGNMHYCLTYVIAIPMATLCVGIMTFSIEEGQLTYGEAGIGGRRSTVESQSRGGIETNGSDLAHSMNEIVAGSLHSLVHGSRNCFPRNQCGT